ncbi:MAG: PAS domain S-box protein, partial [Anaerolineae bacterium]|nr:PAS domain S-box protein [Anaerolineae bacterium]
MTTIKNAELEHLRQRIKSLEIIEREYKQLEKLLEDAASNKNLEKYANEIILYIQPDNGQIVDTNVQAIEFLGYDREDLLTHTLDELEIPNSQENVQVYLESPIQIQVYNCRIKHKDGYEQAAVVKKWLIPKNNKSLLCYSLEDQSLRAQLWAELNRREDADYQFQEKLKTLNEITIELGHLESFHDICKRSVELGIQKLGFDRLALFFLDSTKTLMTGTFGVDEQGVVRDERSQSWSFSNTFIMDFVNGKREPIIRQDSAPLYNEKSEVVGYGWHVSVPILDGGKFIGFMTTDNLINQKEMEDFQPDLLRLFGATVGHLTARQLEQETIRKLSSAIQHSASMIIVLNNQQLIEFANDAFHQFSGYSDQEIMGKDFSILFQIESFQAIRQTISSGQSWQGELVNQTKNGEAYEAFVSISPVRLGDIVENYVIVQEDITVLKQARQKELALQLEQERARILETFISDIGHEFKTPLSIIHTSNFILGQSIDENTRNKHMGRIQDQVDILDQMLDDILEIVTLTNTLELKTQPVWLDGFVQNIVNSVTPFADGKQLTWDVELASRVVLHVDAHKLARIIYEILINAVQYTPVQGKISVRLAKYEKQVGIVIQDTGIGIQADELEKIFHRFYRVDKARTVRSTGIGLSVAKLLVDAHQGKLTVESEPGKGSRFEVLLPLEYD